MSRIHRIVEKAEREGLMTWTRSPEEPSAPLRASAGVAAVAEAPANPPFAPTFAPPEEGGDAWDAPADVAGDEHGGIDPMFVAATEPGSSAAEQYRLLRTRIEGLDNGRRLQTLIVTSPRTGDGKTTTCANLAITMAQEFQQKVVLVEADLRRPALAALFGVTGTPGLVDVLIGAASLDEALHEVPGQRLFLLPAGMPAARSTELLGSSMMQRVLEGLRARFTRVVVDTPPVVLADTHVIARLADGILLVVRAGMTPRPAVERAMAAVDRQKVLGLVLNEVEEAVNSYAYSGLQPAQTGDE